MKRYAKRDSFLSLDLDAGFNHYQRVRASTRFTCPLCKHIVIGRCTRCSSTG